MSGVSKSGLKKASSRIREGQRNPADIEMIEAYRAEKLPSLCEVLSDVRRALSAAGIKYLVAGRSKRMKSIIRKIARTPESNVATLVDIVGLRIVVAGPDEQELVLQTLCASLDVRDVKDYRSTGRTDGYRCTHLYVNASAGAVEVQVRTVAQHLWAIESEYLGEKVKEGGGTACERAYLAALNNLCILLDAGTQWESILEVSGDIGSIRGPIRGRYPALMDSFLSLRETDQSQMHFSVVVFDDRTMELMSSDEFRIDRPDSASEEYRRLSRELPEDRFDILLLTSTSNSALKVTHPLYFPSF